MDSEEIKKRQHVIPRLYLEGFCDQDDMVWTYSKEEPTKQPYPQKPDKIAIENYFYTFYGSNIKPNVFEDALANFVESPAAEPLRQLREFKIPSFVDRQRLAVLFGFMLVRTPSYKNSSNELINKSLNLKLKNMASNMDSFQESWSKYSAFTREPQPEDIEDLRGQILNGDFKLELKPNYSLGVIQTLGFEMSFLLATMKWMVYKAPNNLNFITGDCPVLLEDLCVNKFDPSFLSVIGAKILIPISRSIGLLMLRENEESFDTDLIIDDMDVVSTMNQLMISSAAKYVYACENSKEILSQINS